MIPTLVMQGVPGDVDIPAPAPRAPTGFDRFVDRALVEVDLGLPSGVHLGIDVTRRNAVGVRAGLGVAIARGAPEAGILGVFTRLRITAAGDAWVEPTVGLAFLGGTEGALGGLALGYEVMEKDGMQPAIALVGGADLTFALGRAWAIPELAVAATW